MPGSALPAHGGGGLSRFHLSEFFSWSHRDFDSIVVDGPREFGFNTAAQAVGGDDLCGCSEAEDPGNQLELTAYVQLHSNPSTAHFAALLGGVPDPGAHVFGNVGAEDDFNIEGVFLHESKCRLEIALHGKVRGLFEVIV